MNPVTCRLPTSGSLRCNQCSLLFTIKNVEYKSGEPFCRCGGRSWFASKTTLLEMAMFAFGFDERLSISGLWLRDGELGGTLEYMAAPRAVERIK